MLVHTDPKLQKAIVLSFPRDLWVNIPGHGDGQDQRGVLGRIGGVRRPTGRQDGRAADRPQDQPRALRGSRRLPGDRRHAGRGHDVHPDRDDRSAHRAGRQGGMPDAQRLPSAGLRAHAPPAVRPGSRLRADRPAAAVPPRGVEPAPVAGRDREGAVAHPSRRSQPRRRRRASTSRTSSTWSSSSRGSRRARWSSGRFPASARPRDRLDVVLPRPGRRADLRADPAGQAARRPRSEPGRYGSVRGEHRRSGRRSRFGGDGGEGGADPAATPGSTRLPGSSTTRRTAPT